MTATTTRYSFPFPTGTDPVVVHTDIKALAEKVEEALYNSQWFKEHSLTTSDNLDNLPSGVRTSWSGATSLALGLPDNLMFTVKTERWGTSAGIQEAQGRGTDFVVVYRRQLLSGGWTPWRDVSPFVDTRALTSSDNLDELRTGVRTVWSGSVASDLGLPRATLGKVETVRWGSSAAVQTFETRALEVETFKRALLSGGWSAWKKQGESKTSNKVAPLSRGSGVKTLPLPLTEGSGGGSVMPTSASVLYKTIKLAKSIKTFRYRIALRDGNPRFGVNRSNQVQLSNLSVGGVQKIASATTPSNGDLWYSPYLTGPIGDLAFDYVASQAPIGNVGGGTLNGSNATVLPFEIWLEIEVPVGTPAGGILGDSNSVGVGTSVPLRDSYWAVYCESKGIFPVIYGHSGDSMSASADPDAWKFTRWDHLDSPDMLLFMLGSNDLGSGTLTLPEYQERFKATLDVAVTKISPVVHVGTLKPRNNPSGNYNTVRKEVNVWLITLPYGVREWHDLNSPVSSDDLTILPQYNVDGVHMNTAGHLKLATSITKLVTIPGGLVFDESAGRVIKAWDYFNNREQLVYGDTGSRDISAIISSGFTNIPGTAILRRNGNIVTLTINSMGRSEAGTGNVTVLTLPTGFRPEANRYDFTFRDFRCAVLTSGVVYITTPSMPVDYLSFTFATNDDWPSSLPGSAVGTIPFK